MNETVTDKAGEMRVEIALGDRIPSQYQMDRLSEFFLARYLEEMKRKEEAKGNEQ